MFGAERSENARLRRVDWRFLLRQERAPAALCRGSRRLERAVRAIATAGTDPDLAVLVNPTRRSLASAYARLRPGGELYVEWWAPTGAASAQRRLEAAGFVDVRRYWPWPPPVRGRTRFWLPLDAPEAIEAWIRPRRSLGLAGKATTTLWCAAERAGLLVPLCVVARKPGGEGAGIDLRLRDRWGVERVSSLLLTSGERSVNKVVGLVFADGEHEPRAAVKFARTANEDASVRDEAEHLRLVREQRPQLYGVPDVLDLATSCGRAAVVEGAVSGRPLMQTLDLENLEHHARAVTEWLVALAGTAEPEPRSAWWERLVEPALQEFETLFTSVVDRAELALARAVLSAVEASPVVFEHRDCSPWNVLANGEGRIAVVDWESAQPQGLAGLDLVYFLTHAAAFADGRPRWWADRRFYDELLDPQTRLGRIVDRCVDRYCAEVGLDRAGLHPLRLLCWAIHARSEHRRLTSDAKPLADSMFLHLWRQQLRRSART